MERNIGVVETNFSYAFLTHKYDSTTFRDCYPNPLQSFVFSISNAFRNAISHMIILCAADMLAWNELDEELTQLLAAATGTKDIPSNKIPFLTRPFLFFTTGLTRLLSSVSSQSGSLLEKLSVLNRIPTPFGGRPPLVFRPKTTSEHRRVQLLPPSERLRKCSAPLRPPSDGISI